MTEASAAPSDENTRDDNVLGMDSGITRRDFLNATLLASGGALLSFRIAREFYSRHALPTQTMTIGPAMAASAITRLLTANTTGVMEAGHEIRDGKFESLPVNTIDTRETYDCVVVGGGISGLAAALIFQKQAGKGKTCLVLDNHPIFGGEAKRKRISGGRAIA